MSKMHEAKMPSLKDEIEEKAKKNNEERRKKVRKERKTKERRAKKTRGGSRASANKSKKKSYEK